MHQKGERAPATSTNCIYRNFSKRYKSNTKRFQEINEYSNIILITSQLNATDSTISLYVMLHSDVGK